MLYSLCVVAIIVKYLYALTPKPQHHPAVHIRHVTDRKRKFVIARQRMSETLALSATAGNLQHYSHWDERVCGRRTRGVHVDGVRAVAVLGFSFFFGGGGLGWRHFHLGDTQLGLILSC